MMQLACHGNCHNQSEVDGAWATVYYAGNPFLVNDLEREEMLKDRRIVYDTLVIQGNDTGDDGDDVGDDHDDNMTMMMSIY